ncbi:MAG: DUF6785 family protein, partial [bacterium]
SLGAGATGYWGSWHWRVATFDVTGGFLVVGAFLVWTARPALAAWARRAAAGTRDAEQDPIPPRPALALSLAGLAGMTGWSVLAGSSWWIALLGVVLFLVMLLVLTRIIAEVGLIFVQCGMIPYDVITGLLPASWLNGFTMNSLMMHKAVFTHDHREVFMPYAMDGARAAERFRLPVGRVLGVFAATAVLAMAVSAYARVATGYKYGAVNTDIWANEMAPNWFMGGVAKLRTNPPPFELVRVGGRDVFPVNGLHLLAGAGVAGALLALRARFAWWPLHPVGLIMCAPYTMSKFWFSIFLGWLLKTLVMRFGGARGYRRLLPLFLGFVLGESVIAALWMVVGLVTGTPSLAILPS